jgi:hypothetical protein
MLEQREKDTELVIVGDACGLWEFTTAEGVEKSKCTERTGWDQTRPAGTLAFVRGHEQV